MIRPALIILILAALGLTAYSFRSYLEIRSGEEDLDYLRRQVGQLEEKVTEQEGALAYYLSPEFIYKEALEQLGFTMPGEVIPVLSDLKDKEKVEADADPAEPAAYAAAEPLPYWKRWRTLFLEN